MTSAAAVVASDAVCTPIAVPPPLMLPVVHCLLDKIHSSGTSSMSLETADTGL